MQLYKQFVRCHLEFAVPAWSPWQTGDIDVLERIQKTAINLITNLQGRTYKDKLSELGLRSLRDRRIRLDLIQTFKIVHGFDRVDHSTWFKMVGDNVIRPTRNTAYPKNIIGDRSNTEIRRNFFSNRVVPTWNALPTELKDSRSVGMFKSGLDKIIF